MSVQGSVGAGPKPIEQMSKKERKVLKEKELEDLDDLLGEFGVTLDKPQETNDVKVDPSNGVQIENANSIVKEGASQREKVRERELGWNGLLANLPYTYLNDIWHAHCGVFYVFSSINKSPLMTQHSPYITT